MKRDIYFSKPFMNAAGILGFAPDFRGFREASPKQNEGSENFGDLQLGAFVTNPLSLRPRVPAAKPEIIEYPGGFLLHTGLPNPGFNTALKRYSSRWDKSDLPIIVHLMADRPEETQHMVQMLEMQENVMAVELGFAPLLADDILLLTLEMTFGELPLIFSLPIEQILSLGPRLIQEGAQAISISAPRGALPLSPHAPAQLRFGDYPGSVRQDRCSGRRDSEVEARSGKLITGRLYGPSLFPRTLETVYSVAKLGLPIIGAGGVWSKENAEAMLSAGALAVQIDAALWHPNFTFSAPGP